MKAATAAASSGSSQMEDSRAVAETPTQQNSTTDESRMDVEGAERDESRSSKAQNTRRRVTTKTSMEKWMTKGKKETNSEVRHHRTPDDELRQKRHWKRTTVTRERWHP